MHIQLNSQAKIKETTKALSFQKVYLKTFYFNTSKASGVYVSYK